MKLSSLAAACAAAILFAAPQAFAQTIGFGTSNPGSIYHSSGSVIAKLVGEKTDLKTTIQPFASPNVYIPAVNAGALDFGLGNVYEAELAVSGKAFYSGRPNPNLRAVAVMYPLRVALFVRKDSKFMTVADLKGEAMPDGYTSQQILLPILDASYAPYGLTRGDFKAVRVPNVVGGANDFMAGRVAGFLFAMGSAKVREADASVSGIRALGVPDTPESLAAVKKHLPLAYIRAEKPSPRNPGVLAPMHAIAYDALVFASAKTSEDAVYKVTKVMYESAEEMAKAFGPFALFAQKSMAKDLGPIQYHPGAIRFYKEKGLWPPK
jgi:hypothetical protein